MARPDFTRHLVIAVIPLIATSHEKGEVAMAGMRVMGRQSWKRNDNCERRSAHFIAKKEARRWLSPAPFPGLSRQGSGGRGSASGAAALIEVEVRDGLVFGQVAGRRLIEIGVVHPTRRAFGATDPDGFKLTISTEESARRYG